MALPLGRTKTAPMIRKKDAMLYPPSPDLPSPKAYLPWTSGYPSPIHFHPAHSALKPMCQRAAKRGAPIVLYLSNAELSGQTPFAWS